jgi:hypothetical protein
MERSPRGTVGILLLVFGVSTTIGAGFWAYEAFTPPKLVGLVAGTGLVDVAVLLHLAAMLAVGIATMLLGLLLVTARFG